MRKHIVYVAVAVCCFGCARVQVHAPKEPIKVDISMRLDIYQHIEKDISAIEDIVSGSPAKTQAPDKQGFLGLGITNAYAEEGLSPEVEAAAYRRRDRKSGVDSLLGKGSIGENKSGLLTVRDSAADASVQQLVSDENSDRMAIYNAIAAKNSSSVAEVQKLYAKRLQNDAPAGAPIEVLDEATGAAAWKTK